MARYDDINSKIVLYATVLSAVVLFGLIQAGQAMYFYLGNTVEERRLASSNYLASKAVIAEQRASVGEYRWVKEPPATEGEEAKKRLNIPLEQAKKVILQEIDTVEKPEA